MSAPAILRALGILALGFGFLLSVNTRAEVINRKLEIEYWGGITLNSTEAALSRFTLKPSARLQLNEHWQADLALRGEFARDRTGLGTVATYSDASRPLLDNTETRIEIDRAILVKRAGATALTLGKQTIPWGVLDGVQVTDRFDAIRRRDFVLTEVRPERLSRWGVRVRSEVRNFGIDAAVLADPTVAQLPGEGDLFEPLAPRLRGGLPADASTPRVQVSDRGDYREDATAGIRLSYRFADLEATVLTLRGPDTDPLLKLSGGIDEPALLLDYPRRSLHGATLEGAAGNTIWRMELAHVPDQRVNVRSEALLSSSVRSRWLAGVGVDWNAPGGWFVNTQLAVDQVESGERALVRPDRDVFATLRVQRGFRQETLRLAVELLGTVSDRDGALRPSLEWRTTDHIKLALGADLLFGDAESLFGQYRDASRLWLRVTVNL